MRTPTKRRRKTARKVSGGLAGFAEAKKTKNPLLREIQSHVVAEGNKNAGVGREEHKIHVSELIKDTMCPRQLFYKLSKTERTDPPEPAFHRLEWIWTSGHDTHHKYQRWLKEMGDLWGTWTCLHCSEQWLDVSPACCTSCGRNMLRYDEVELEDDFYSIVGHADGAVPRLNCLVEIKSFAIGTIRIEAPDLVKQHTVRTQEGKQIVDLESLWTSIKRPLKSHLKQGMFYLWMCKRMGLPYDKIVFIYENKTSQATKAFEVKFSERFISEQIEVMDDVLVHVGEGVPPARPKMYVKGSKPCNHCVFRSECWSTEEETDDDRTSGTAVPARRSRTRSQEKAGAAEDLPAEATRASVPRDSGRPNRFTRRGPDRSDDATDEVGRAPRDTTGVRRGGRAVGAGSDGQVQGSRFARKSQGRDRAQGEGVRERRVPRR